MFEIEDMQSDKRKQSVLEAIKKKADEILPTGSRVRLFGSRARGDAREDSDWDLHILIPGEERLSSKVRGDLCYPFELLGWDLNEDFNVIMHTFQGWEKRSFLPLYHNIETEGIDI